MVCTVPYHELRIIRYDLVRYDTMYRCRLHIYILFLESKQILETILHAECFELSLWFYCGIYCYGSGHILLWFWAYAIMVLGIYCYGSGHILLWFWAYTVMVLGIYCYGSDFDCRNIKIISFISRCVLSYINTLFLLNFLLILIRSNCFQCGRGFVSLIDR